MEVAVAPASSNAVQVTVRIGNDTERVYFHSSDVELSPVGDVGLTATLAIAMRYGTRLECREPISPVLAARLDDFQMLLSRWYPILRPVQVLAPTRRPSPPMGTETFCFFSGGVDSFYTLLRNNARVDAGVYVHGFDVEVDDSDRRAMVSRSLRKTMDGLGKELIEIETDLRSLSNIHLDWHPYVSSALAAATHVLPDRFSRALIAGALAYHELLPISSHPLTDPLLSSDRITIEHDGCDATRREKLEYISRHPVVQQNLRVCWENVGSSFNCGTCEKCVRTMLGLESFGVLGEFTCFPQVLDPDVVRQVDVAGRMARRWAIENLRELRRANCDPKIIRALAESIARSDLRRANRRIRHVVPARWRRGDPAQSDDTGQRLQRPESESSVGSESTQAV